MTARRFFIFSCIGFFAAIAAWPAIAATSCMANWSCSSSQCASVMGGSSGQKGPFDSASACQAWANQYNRNTTCSCTESSSGSAKSGSSNLGSIPVTPVPSTVNPAAAAGLMLGGMMIGEGLRQLMEGDPQEEARKRVEQEARAGKLKQLQEERLTGILYRLLNGRALPPGQVHNVALKGDTDGSSLSLKLGDTPSAVRHGPNPPPAQASGSQQEKDAYVRGKKDAADCLPMNSGGYCVGLSPEVTLKCVENYKNGFRVGERAAANTLQQAYRKGQEDKKADRQPDSLSHQVGGTCGTHWYEAYNSGYGGKPFNGSVR
jgi:hypothetical protein